jgi:hypothetical protein
MRSSGRCIASAGSGTPAAHLGPGDEVYKFAPRRMPEAVGEDELKSLLRGGAPAGRNEYRILHRDLVATARQNVPQRLEGLDDVGKVWDRTQGKIKTALTVPNPQYHLTNLYGDLHNAYLGSNVVSLARSLGVSTRVLKHKAKREAALKTLDKQVDPAGKGVKIGDARVSVADLLDEAERHGAIGQGFIGRDLADVLDAQGKEAGERLGRGKVTGKLGETGRKIGTGKITGRLAHPIDTIRDISQYREDGVRLATYIAGRRRGLTPDQAAAYVARHHFDYADLTTLERTSCAASSPSTRSPPATRPCRSGRCSRSRASTPTSRKSGRKPGRPPTSRPATNRASGCSSSKASPSPSPAPANCSTRSSRQWTCPGSPSATRATT